MESANAKHVPVFIQERGQFLETFHHDIIRPILRWIEEFGAMRKNHEGTPPAFKRLPQQRFHFIV